MCAFFRGPRTIVDESLVLHLDAANVKSFPGEPTTNLVNPNLSSWGTDGSGWASGGTRTILSAYHCSIVDVNQNTRQNIYITTGLTGNTTYTFSLKYLKVTGTPTLRFQMWFYQTDTVLGTTFPTTSQIGISDIDGWQTATYTYNSPVNTNKIRWYIQDGNDYTGYNHVFEVKEPQLEQKSYATPFVNGTRGSTVATGGGWKDLSDNGNNGTLSGVTFDDNNSGSLVFNNNYITVPHSTTLDNASEISVECWIKTTYDAAFPGECGIIKKGGATAGWSSAGWSIRLRDDIPAFALRKSDDSGYWDLYTGDKVIDNMWHHIVGTFDTSNIKKYVDGVLTQQTTTGQAYLTSTNSLEIGRVTNYFTGNISNIKVYNRALSIDEVKQNYNALRYRYEERIVTSGLILYLDAGKTTSYPGTGSIWYDISGRGKNHTIVASPTFTSSPKGFVLDGSTQGFTYNGQLITSSVCTVVIFYKTSEPGELWVRGNQSGSYYLSASNSNTYYHSNVGTPTNYIDLNVVTNPTTPVNYKDGNYHMWEAKNVNLSTWTYFEWFLYPGGWQLNGTVSAILVYDRVLTSEESLQNYNELKNRFNI